MKEVGTIIYEHREKIMFSDDDIDLLIQKLYAWKEKREAVNRKRDGNPEFRNLDQTLIAQAIKCITELRMKAERVGSGRLG